MQAQGEAPVDICFNDNDLERCCIAFIGNLNFMTFFIHLQSSIDEENKFQIDSRLVMTLKLFLSSHVLQSTYGMLSPFEYKNKKKK